MVFFCNLMVSLASLLKWNEMPPREQEGVLKSPRAVLNDYEWIGPPHNGVGVGVGSFNKYAIPSRVLCLQDCSSSYLSGDPAIGSEVACPCTTCARDNDLSDVFKGLKASSLYKSAGQDLLLRYGKCPVSSRHSSCMYTEAWGKEVTWESRRKSLDL